MSKYIDEKFHSNDGIAIIIQTEDGKYHWVDGCYIIPELRLSPKAYEVMSFPYDIESGKVVNWSEEFVRFYDTFQEMVLDMVEMRDNLEDYLDD